ncbi:MAG: type II toxin-antitoxin system HicA family toxin [Desulfobacteraceae bacterium]|nr:type II toxin-antitoxin system HicA family toxin [Desulfobacteraceae bacterium]
MTLINLNKEQKFGYKKVAQKGNYIKMKNYVSGSIVIIPEHKELDRWTLRTILKQAEISEQDFNDHLRR